MKDNELLQRANRTVPSKNQLAFTELEFSAFIHFGMNTFTNSEQGTGREPEKYFNPPEVDAEQWVKAIKTAGMKGLILTCKYSDGFCLWPSAYTSHSVINSPWLEGKGDVVKLVSDECRKQGIKFGIYLSPLDRHEESFGSESYNDFFVSQLKELLSDYGEIYCVWFPRDNESGFHYDWERYYKTVRELQPGAVICDCGPDIRWVGNLGGVSRSEEWNAVPFDLLNNAPVQKLVQPDLGSRKKIKKAKELVWYPPVTYVSLRPGWFYHKEEETSLKMLSKILDIYFRSVGNNGSMVLNIPPSHTGKIEKKDLDSLVTLGAQLKIEFKHNYALEGTFEAEKERDELHTAAMINEENGYWHSGEFDKKTSITLDLGKVQFINKVVLGENEATGQQIEKFNILYFFDNKWRKIYSGNTIGRKKICNLPPMNARRLRLDIIKTRGFATIKKFEVY